MKRSNLLRDILVALLVVYAICSLVWVGRKMEKDYQEMQRKSEKRKTSLVATDSLIVADTVIVTCRELHGTQKSVASWYGASYQGKTMANGRPFDTLANTFAHKTIPFGTKIRFIYKGKEVVAVCTDRGPFIEGRDFDFSQGVAFRLRFVSAGVDTIHWAYFSDPDSTK
jgi:rare lipoprotein A